MSDNWFEHLKLGLERALPGRCFAQSSVDPCVFYRPDCILLCYVDDCVLVSKDVNVIDCIIDSLINGPEEFILTDEGTIKNYIGVQMKPGPNPGTFELS